MACERPAEAPAEGAEVVEDVIGMSERGGVSSRSPTEENGLLPGPDDKGKEGAMAMVAHGLDARVCVAWVREVLEKAGRRVGDCQPRFTHLTSLESALTVFLDSFNLLLAPN